MRVSPVTNTGKMKILKSMRFAMQADINVAPYYPINSKENVKKILMLIDYYLRIAFKKKPMKEKE